MRPVVQPGNVRPRRAVLIVGTIFAMSGFVVAGVTGGAAFAATDTVRPDVPGVIPATCTEATAGQTVWEGMIAPASAPGVSYSAVSVSAGHEASVTASLGDGFAWDGADAGWVPNGNGSLTWTYQLRSTVCPAAESSTAPSDPGDAGSSGSGGSNGANGSGDSGDSSGTSDSSGTAGSGGDAAGAGDSSGGGADAGGSGSGSGAGGSGSGDSGAGGSGSGGSGSGGTGSGGAGSGSSGAGASGGDGFGANGSGPGDSSGEDASPQHTGPGAVGASPEGQGAGGTDAGSGGSPTVVPYGTGDVKVWSESAGSVGVKANASKLENAQSDGPNAGGPNSDGTNAESAVPKGSPDDGEDDLDSDDAAVDPQPTTQGFTTDEDGDSTAPPRENDVVLPDSMQSADSDSDAIPPQSDSTLSPDLVHTGGSLPFMTIAAALSLVFAGLTLFITVRRRDA